LSCEIAAALGFPFSTRWHAYVLDESVHVNTGGLFWPVILIPGIFKAFRIEARYFA
jgi:hypothetical protein